MTAEPSVSYDEFLARKAQLANAGGFEPIHLPDHLFDFQRALVDWAVRQGRAALFADCGMGKTPMALAWAENVYLHTGKPVLLLTPLAVGFQIVAEAEKFGHEAAMSRDGTITAPITVTNYEQLPKFDWERFGGVVCDESSALKSFEGVTRAAVTEFMRRIQYRLLRHCDRRAQRLHRTGYILGSARPPGPWEMRDGYVYPLSISARLGGIWPADAKFIAASRSLVPELAARLGALERAVTQVRQLLPEVQSAIAAGIRGYVACEAMALSYHEPRTDRRALEKVGADAEAIAAYVTTSTAWRDILRAIDGTGP